MRDRCLQSINRLELWLADRRGDWRMLPLRAVGQVAIVAFLMLANLLALAAWPARVLGRRGSDTCTDDRPLDAGPAELAQWQADNTPLLVDFWAPWCGPCVMMEPALRALAKERAGALRIARVDCTRHGPLAQEHGVRGLPTLILFRPNGEIARQTGALSLNELQTWLHEQLFDKT